MSLLKQTQHSLYEMTLEVTSKLKTGFDLHSRAVQNYPFRANLGILLLCLALLMSITLLTTVTFISSLWLPITMMFKKFIELFGPTGIPGWNVQSTLCLWADAVKNMFSTKNKSQSSAWNKDGDSAQECTLDSSVMLGGRENEFDAEQYINEQHERAMKARIDTPEQRAREAGL